MQIYIIKTQKEVQDIIFRQCLIPLLFNTYSCLDQLVKLKQMVLK